jgi:multidrug efflux pump subunit AcrA (membrane-fusion protein)
VATTPSGSNGSSTPTITVLVAPDNPSATGSLDQAAVEVSITNGSAKNVLIVPIDALLALASGGYALEVIGPKGVHSLEPVTLGLFDDANEQVQVSGSGVVAGQRIVIPAS